MAYGKDSKDKYKIPQRPDGREHPGMYDPYSMVVSKGGKVTYTKKKVRERLLPWERSACRMLVVAKGTSRVNSTSRNDLYEKVAKHFDMHPQTIRKMQYKNAAKIYMAELEDRAEEKAIDVAADIKAMAVRAVEVIDELLNKANVEDTTKLAAAKDTLDRAGYHKGKEVEAPQEAPTQINVKEMTVIQLRDYIAKKLAES